MVVKLRKGGDGGQKTGGSFSQKKKEGSNRVSLGNEKLAKKEGV
jgi:hypothetical protein